MMMIYSSEAVAPPYCAKQICGQRDYFQATRGGQPSAYLRFRASPPAAFSRQQPFATPSHGAARHRLIIAGGHNDAVAEINGKIDLRS